MDPWQIVALVFVALLPFTLLLDFHPRRERLNASGRPIDRSWPAASAPPAGDAEGGADPAHGSHDASGSRPHPDAPA